MKNVVKRLTSFSDVEKEFENQFGVIVEDVVFTTADTNVTIAHDLGYDITGYMVIKCDTYGVFKFISSDNNDLILQCNTNSTTASFRIF